MTEKKKSLLERLQSGELELPTEAEAAHGRDLGSDFKDTISFMEETRAAALAAPRKPGRPSKVAVRRQTEVRGVRLEISLWGALDIEADRKGCSVNRYIEESILGRLGLLAAENDLFELKQAGTYTTGNPYSMPSRKYEKVLSFDRSAA